MKTKINQRKLCRLKILKIPQSAKKHHDLAIFNKISKYLIANKIKSIGIYWSTKNEVDTRKIINFSYENNIKIFLPKIVKNKMVFYEFYQNRNLIYNEKFNIFEPAITASKLNLNDSIMIIPIVGYDNYFNRIGNGYGFYDKYLYNLNIFKLGIAYKIQKIEKINTDSHDIQMDLIIDN